MHTRKPMHACRMVAMAAACCLAMPGTRANAQVPQSFSACYVPTVGAIYLIKLAGLPAACLSSGHIEITWKEGATGAAGGDLSGSFPNPSVAKLLGRALATTPPAAGQVLSFDGTSWVAVTPAGGSGGIAGGDLSGSYPSPTVVKLQGKGVASTAPTSGQVLSWNAIMSLWQPSTPSSGVSVHAQLSGLTADDHPQYLLTNGTRALTGALALGGFKLTGLAAATVAGDAVRFEQAVKVGDGASGDVSGTFTNLVVGRLQGRALSSTAPTSGQVLAWNSATSLWQPSTPASGVSVHGQLSGLTADDHQQYLLTNGTRALTGGLSLGGFKLTGLGAATMAGDAVRFEQAVKVGDAAGGDVSGSFANLLVAKLQGRALSSTAPTSGQVLSWNSTTSLWQPSTPATGVSVHGQLSGLSADDHPQYLLTNGVRATTNGFAVTGVVGTGTIPASGPGTRLMWYPAKGAFRVGTAEGTYWDDQNIGVGSLAAGSGTRASGAYSMAVGLATSADGNESTAMGYNNGAHGNFSVAMGENNLASGANSTAMGWQNFATGQYSTAMGHNTHASGDLSTAMGSQTTASGTYSTAMGENAIASGDYSTAMGRNASTNAQAGSFVWGDHTTIATINSAAPGQFAIRASGGVRLRTRADLGTGCDLTISGSSWVCTSSKTVKTDFADIPGDTLLARLHDLPVRTWRFKGEDSTIRHMGPFAEDFRAAFGLGTDSLTIGHIDLGGVSLAAAKALEARTGDLRAALEAKDVEFRAALRTKDGEIAALRTTLSALEQRLEKLEKRREP